MSRFRVLCTGLALAFAGCVAAGQTAVTNFFGDEVTLKVGLSDRGNDLGGYQSLIPEFNGSQLTGTWAADGRYVDSESVFDPDSQTVLLSSPDGADANESWTLFLTDLDFGQQAAPQPWNQIITAVPEPAAWTLLGVGGFTLMGGCLLRRRCSS